MYNSTVLDHYHQDSINYSVKKKVIVPVIAIISINYILKKKKNIQHDQMLKPTRKHIAQKESDLPESDSFRHAT